MPNSEPKRRRSRISAELTELKVDALLVSFGPNVRYLSGFTGSNGMLLLLPDTATLFTDPRYRLQAAQEADCRVRVCKGPLLLHIVSAVVRNKIRRLGFERSRTSFEAYDYLNSQMPLRSSLEPIAGIVERHRMRKSESEIALIRRSVAANSDAFEQAVASAKAGMSECDLSAELDYRMRRMGAERTAFETIVATGVRTALPHARPNGTALASSQLLLIDMGAMVDGYASDMTRMLFLGRPNQKLKKVYRTVLEAQLAAIDAVRPGVTAWRVDRAARQVLRAEGLDKAFVHSTGHGLGLEIHEPPRIGRKEKIRLEPGMTITIEPGVYLEGFGGIRIEDTVAVTGNGCEVLTPTSKELRIL